MSTRLSPQREAEIRNRRLNEVTPGPWLVSEDQDGQALVYVERKTKQGQTYAHVLLTADWATEADVQFVCSARRSVPELLAELAAVRAERDEARTDLAKYVGHEPTIAEEMAYLSHCLNDVRSVCDGAEEGAKRWENPLPVPEWVPVVREAADGVRPDDPNDRRRRIYIDGKGNGWIDLNRDAATGEQNVTGLTDQWQIKSTDDVREATGSIREIGRCW